MFLKTAKNLMLSMSCAMVFATPAPGQSGPVPNARGQTPQGPDSKLSAKIAIPKAAKATGPAATCCAKISLPLPKAK